jgi:hypothetical protein
MVKTDFKAEQPKLCRPWPKSFEIVDVPEMAFLMIDGSPACTRVTCPKTA